MPARAKRSDATRDGGQTTKKAKGEFQTVMLCFAWLCARVCACVCTCVCVHVCVCACTCLVGRALFH